MQPLNNAHYDCVADFLASVSKCRNDANNKYRVEFLTRKNDHDWLGAGCITGNDVLRLMQDGWPEGQRKMTTLLDGFDTDGLVPQDTRRRLTRGDMGDHLDIGSVYAGRIGTAWTSARRRSVNAPQRIELLVDTGVSSFESADTVFWRGAAAVALADKLSQAGYMVRISVGYDTQTNSDESGSVRVVVKDYDKPLDMATAATVMLPGFFRSLMLAWTVGHATRKIQTGVGYRQDAKAKNGEIMIGASVSNEQSARQWLAKAIERLNPAQAA